MQKFCRYVTLNTNCLGGVTMEIICVKSNNFVDILSKQCNIISKNINSARQQIVVVPSELKVQTEIEIMKTLNLGATFSVEVCDFDELYSKFVGENSVLSSYQELLLMQNAMASEIGKLKIFKQVSLSNCKMILSIINSFIENRVEISQIECVIPKMKGGLQAKLNDILILWTEWNRLRENNCVKSEKSTLLAKQIEKLPLENFDFIFWGFSYFTPTQGLIIEAMAKKANSVILGVVSSQKNQPNADLFLDDTENLVNFIAKNLSLKIDEQNAICSLPLFSSQILTNVGASNLQSMSLDEPSVRIFSATSIGMEVEFVAQEIWNKVRVGTRFRDCVVYCPNMSAYSPFIEQVFNKYNLPYKMQKTIPFSQIECVKFLKACFDCVLNGFLPIDVIKVVRNPFSGLTLDETAIFDDVSTAFGIYGEKFKNLERPKFEDKKFDLFVEIRKKLEFLLSFNEKVKLAKTWGDYIACVKELLNETKIEDKINSLDQNFREINLKASKKFVRCLDDIEAFCPDLTLPFKTFVEMLFNNQEIGCPFENVLDSVFVVDSVWSRRVPNLYVLGAVEGALPSFQSDIALLDDNDLFELGKCNIVLPGVKLQNLWGKAEALQNISVATNTLTFTYPLHIGADKCEPASFVDDVARCFLYNGKPLPTMFLGEVLQNNETFGGEEGRLSRLWTQKDKMLFGFVDGLLGESVSNSALSTAYSRLVQNGYNKTIKSILKLANKENNIQNLADSKLAFLSKNKLRVTQIEKFFECPYAHFVSYAILPNERKVHRLTSLDVGNIIHAVLENFVKKIIKNEPILDVDVLVSKIFEYVINRKDYNHLLYGGDNKLFISELKQEAIRVCKAVLNQFEHGEYKPKFVEASFGQDDFAPIPKVKVSGNEVNIVGKVDRVDAWQNRLRIIDYKTSKLSGKFNLNSFYLGKKIQLFYYMKVLIDEKGYQPGGAYYMPVHREYSQDAERTNFASFKLDGVSLYTEANMFAQDNQVNFDHPSSDIVKFDISTSKENQANGVIQLKTSVNSYSTATAEQLDSLLDYAKDVLYSAVEDIVNGEIRPLFANGACNFCKYKYMCKYGATQDAKERKSNYTIKLDGFKRGTESEI